MPELADFYSAKMSYYYTCPSRGAADGDNSFEFWYANRPDVIADDATGWVRKQYDLAAEGLSRTGVNVEFHFTDDIETGGQIGGVPKGPCIDDFKVAGFKYGPTKDLVQSAPAGPVAASNFVGEYNDEAQIKLGGGTVQVTWSAPQRTPTDATPDSRSISYRVWRAPAAGGAWTELTSDTDRVTSRQMADAPEPGSYRYAVQAWDAHPGTGYGLHAEKIVSVASQTPGTGVIGGEYRIDGGALIGWSGETTTVAVPGLPGQPKRSMTFRVQAAGGSWSAWKTISFEVKMPTVTSISVPGSCGYKAVSGSGYLKDKGGSPLAGRSVKIELSYDQNVWSPVSTKTTDANGKFTFTHAPSRKTYYRASFAGEAAFGTSSAVGYTLPKASLTTPAAPTTMSYAKTYSVSGYLKPRHTAGTYALRIYKERYVSGTWRSYGYVKAKASNYSTYSKYTGSVRLPYKGKWRLKAVHPTDSLNYKTSSGYDYVTVK
jgi:hypothetical protein